MVIGFHAPADDVGRRFANVSGTAKVMQICRPGRGVILVDHHIFSVHYLPSITSKNNII